MSDLPQRHADLPSAGASVALATGRECHRQRAWAEAYRSLAQADQALPLGAEDLELLAMSAYLVGRDDDYLTMLERAHRAHLAADQDVRAARCAFWLGLRLMFRGETGRATGWLGRAQRLVEREGRDCAEHGYLLLPAAEQQLSAGDIMVAYETANAAAEIGERCGESDLIAIARHLQGRIRLLQGQVPTGLALLDEVMVAVTEGELTPIVTGLLFCSVVEACEQVYALDRAREWTAALAHWCAEQPDMVAFAGVCQVHRAGILQRIGAWPDALAEARRACARCQGVNREAAAAAFYQEGEVHRLKGAFALAEDAYRNASGLGLEPQPGMALLRVAQGRAEAAAAAMRRSMSATAGRLKRLRLLPAHVEIMLAAGDRSAARSACAELEEIARTFDTGIPGALAAEARGAVSLGEGDAEAALVALRHAFEIWQRIEAPYAAARARVLIGLSCRALGDEDGEELELGAARAIFEQLGAAPDVARIDALGTRALPHPSHSLTARELQVLRLVAAGKTNKVIARTLFLSERTVDRHVSNIFAKLDVASRAAATAYAYQHKLV